MKLKYYLRGLAVGVLLATIILSIANAGNRPLTDAQIRQRALELGMIDGDSVKLSSLQAEESTSSGEMYPESTADVTISEDSTEEPGDKSGPTSSASESSGPESTASTSRPSASESSTGSSASASRPSASESSTVSSTPASTVPESSVEADVRLISFQIKSGASSYTVSKELAALGLVEDASAFDTFLCNNGYSKKLHVGTYEIAPGTGEEDIAKLITR